MFVVLGLGFSWQASHYSMGSAARMGPGYFPFWLGIILALLGAIILLRALLPTKRARPIDRFDWQIVFLVVGSVALYGLILKPLGIYISMLVLVLMSSLASHQFSLKIALGNGIFLIVFSYLTFIKGLGLVFPLWPWFLRLP
jgi:hypothetical protein